MRNTISMYGGSPLWNWMAGDIDDFFDRALTVSSSPPGQQVIPYDVEENEAGFLMAVDLPGVKKEDLKIEIVEQSLLITGERKRGDSDGRKIFCRFTIPTSADATKIEANLENGVLEVAIPKAEAAKPRTIQVQSGKSGVFARLLGGPKKSDEKTVHAS